MVTPIFAGPVMALASASALQAAEGSAGIPWWIWFVLIAVLLLLLLIGFARQPEPGQSLPKPGERITPPVAAAVAAESGEDEAPDAPTVVDETADEDLAQTTETADSESGVTAAEVSEAEPVPADDLKRIEGVGPKIAGILGDNGITTFAGLAATEPEQLQELLITAGIRLAHPGTWPEQAGLAAAGQWNELEKMQDSMKGGRKIQI
jgi:predicted flap endonuclease-1-like 5' DNA nuclease